MRRPPFMELIRARWNGDQFVCVGLDSELSKIPKAAQTGMIDETICRFNREIVEATHAKIAIPDELAIIGFGNQPIAADMRPSITTVSIDGARIGREAARLLQQRGENEPTGDIVIEVGFEILSRESA